MLIRIIVKVVISLLQLTSTAAFLKHNRNNHPKVKETSILKMCQLLGMNCATPTDFTFSFTGFRERGGNTDKHSDGWGLAFYEGKGIRAFHDSLPAAESPIAELISRYPVKTLNMIAHIRYATAGEVLLENVHPFQREMWGIQWVFAHNGDVPKFAGGCSSAGFSKYERSIFCDVENFYNPVGDTDSEAVFCAILNVLRDKFKHLPTLPILYDTVASVCKEIVKEVDGQGEACTIFNFLLGCGEHIQFAYSWPGSRPGSSCWNGLHYLVRKPPFKVAHLSDTDYTVDFAQVTSDDDCVAVIATAPLTDDETWTEIQKGELILFDCGLPHKAIDEVHRVERKGHGLKSRVLEKIPLPQEAVEYSNWYSTGGGSYEI